MDDNSEERFMAALREFQEDENFEQRFIAKVRAERAAMYAGPIAQQVADQMQADMDAIAQGDFFVGNSASYGAIPQSSADKCIQFRTNYYNDMAGCAAEFERFEDHFSFSKGYTSEDPVESFLAPPSAQALEAFKQF